jgi:hypothetical protein
MQRQRRSSIAACRNPVHLDLDGALLSVPGFTRKRALVAGGRSSRPNQSPSDA